MEALPCFIKIIPLILVYKKLEALPRIYNNKIIIVFVKLFLLFL